MELAVRIGGLTVSRLLNVSQYKLIDIKESLVGSTDGYGMHLLRINIR